MDEARDRTSEIHRGTRMPNDDREQDGHVMGGLQCWSWYMADLQESDMLQMRHCGPGRNGKLPTCGKRTGGQ
eukprot:5051354-Heterocapsa_arctica.AAC.1